jgi:hypothetical protein
MLIHCPPPSFVTEDRGKADEIARRNKASDPAWDYEVVTRVKGRFVIAVYDPEGDFIGYL